MDELLMQTDEAHADLTRMHAQGNAITELIEIFEMMAEGNGDSRPVLEEQP